MEAKKTFPKGTIITDKVNLTAVSKTGNLLFFASKLKKEQEYNKTHSIYQYINEEKVYCGSLKFAENVTDVKITMLPDNVLSFTQEYQGTKFVPFTFGWRENTILFYKRKTKENITIGRFESFNWRDLKEYNISAAYVKEKDNTRDTPVKEKQEEDDLPF